MNTIKNITVLLLLFWARTGTAQVSHMALMTSGHAGYTVSMPVAASGDKASKKIVLAATLPIPYYHPQLQKQNNAACENSFIGKLIHSNLKISFQLKSFHVNISYL